MTKKERLYLADPKTYERCLYVARHFPNIKEDFAQTYCGGLCGRNQNINRAFIDFLRKEYGRNGSMKRKLKKVSLDNTDLNLASENSTPEEVYDVKQFLKKLDRFPPLERAVLFLHYAYSYEVEEIAHMFSMSNFQIRRIINLIQSMLRSEP